MKNFFENTYLGVFLSFAIPITLMILIECSETFAGIFGLVFFTIISIIFNTYIPHSLSFIIPMSKKYEIKAPDLSQSNKRRFAIIFVLLSLDIVWSYMLLKINYIYSCIYIIILITEIVVLSLHYKKFTILDYINYFSADLFNWHTIYNLPIDENIKKKCFEIHNIDMNYYENNNSKYQKLHISSLEFKAMQKIIKLNNDYQFNSDN